MSKKKAIRLAEETFNQHKLSIPVDIEGLASKLGLGIWKRDLDDEISGMLVIQKDKQGVIVVNGNDLSTRQRFTIAHEIGHALMHHNSRDYFVDTKVSWRKSNYHPTDAYQEIEANTFAANLLMPESSLEQLIDPFSFVDEDKVRKLSQQFKVSRKAMEVRLTSLGYISELDFESENP
jgi:Zn-dependent peptidase ImmA (M78 family)